MKQQDNFPEGLSRPVRRALAGAGYVRLEQLAEVGEDEISGLHGMGPRALEQIRGAMASRGLSFVDRPSS